MSSPVPIALCGQTEAIGKSVIAGLQPEYDVVHFLTSTEAGVKELPHILQGRAPPSPSSSSIGSGNVAAGARAVVLGGAFDMDAIEAMRAACADAGARKVPWLRQDKSKPTPPLGPEYGKAMVMRTKEALQRLEKEGKLDGSNGDVDYY